MNKRNKENQINIVMTHVYFEIKFMKDVLNKFNRNSNFRIYSNLKLNNVNLLKKMGI